LWGRQRRAVAPADWPNRNALLSQPAQPEPGHDGMTVGLPIFRDPAEARLDRLSSQPFRKDHPG
jgi:hypothetical protein